MTTKPAGVVIAAGGLGTRVNGWSRFLPKEFRPVGGRPGLLHVLTEAAATGIRHAVVVHHPCYTPFIDWARQTLTPGALARYQELAQQPVSFPSPTEDLRVDFIAQRGRYADITSALNGSQHLRSADVCLLFSDNIDHGNNSSCNRSTTSLTGETVSPTTMIMIYFRSASRATQQPPTVTQSRPCTEVEPEPRERARRSAQLGRQVMTEFHLCR
ncbi:hypothetical protein ACF08M_40655 [Streptomyces sp. NPDC015032]|uniref:hypothetical protein n=1 Tax=Streptomyces sp. NPDC015032 TaxID=3364937 RepID=UPI003700E1E3